MTVATASSGLWVNSLSYHHHYTNFMMLLRGYSHLSQLAILSFSFKVIFFFCCRPYLSRIKKNKDYCINIYYINKNNRHIKCIIIEIFYRELHILNGPRNCYFLKTRAVVRSYNRVWFPCGFEFWKTFGYVQIYSDII